MKRLLYSLLAVFLVSAFAYAETSQTSSDRRTEVPRLSGGTVWIAHEGPEDTEDAEGSDVSEGEETHDTQSMNMKSSLMEKTVKNKYGVNQINAAQLKAALADKDFTLINVHIPYEGELPQTDYNIPYNKIGQNINKLPDKNQILVVYCRSGGMSAAAARELISLGYTKVIELTGGFNAWKRAGYPFNLTR